MADATPIEWTDATWNPITGCTRVSEGCRNCYAEVMAARFSGPGQWGEGLARIVRDPNGKAIDHRWTGKLRFNDRALDLPLRWRKPRRIFVNSTSDLFHEDVPDEWIDKVFAVMALAPHHTFQLLTKRPERMREYIHPRPSARGPCVQDRIEAIYYANHQYPSAWPLPNVWLGTSIEDQATADARIPHLLATPAAVRFVSAEPLLGPMDLAWAFPDLRTACCLVCGFRTNTVGGFCPNDNSTLRGDVGIDWVIVGGESGPGARPMHPSWARSLRDQCQAAGVAFFFKQWGAWAPVSFSDLASEEMESLEIEGKLGGFSDQPMLLSGKSRAGRLLDGREWNQMPGGVRGG